MYLTLEKWIPYEVILNGTVLNWNLESEATLIFNLLPLLQNNSVKALGDILLFILVEILWGLIISFLYSLTRLSRCIMMMLYCYFVLCEEIA